MDPTKRERLLKAAIKLFARDGFFKAKVEEVAKNAGVATGTTYLYFKNKDDLLISIFEEEMTPIIEEMKEAMAKLSSPQEKVLAFVSRHFEMVKKSPDLALLLVVELRQSNKFLRGYKGTKFKEYLDLLAEAFEQGQQEGVFRTDIPPTILKQVVFGALDQLSTNWVLSKSKRVDLREAAASVGKILLEGIKK